MLLAGIDLAWQSERNTTAIAVAELSSDSLTVVDVQPSLDSMETIKKSLSMIPSLQGIAIDAPLIIENEIGQRLCERALSRVYGSRKASCHTSNLSLYPNPASVSLSRWLSTKGFHHLASGEGQWQIEVYPLPAIIELFQLPERLLYKKGKVADRKIGQVALGEMIRQSGIRLTKNLEHYTSADHINSLRGKALKENEDALDAIICVMIASSYARGLKSVTFGDRNKGYIYVPIHPVAA